MGLVADVEVFRDAEGFENHFFVLRARVISSSRLLRAHSLLKQISFMLLTETVCREVEKQAVRAAPKSLLRSE